MIGRSYFYCCGEIEDNSVITNVRLSPRIFDRLANCNRELDLGLRERLRAILVSELGTVRGSVLIREVTNESRVSYCKLYRLLL